MSRLPVLRYIPLLHKPILLQPNSFPPGAVLLRMLLDAYCILKLLHLFSMGKIDKLYNNIHSKVPIRSEDFEGLAAYFQPLTVKKRSNLIREGEYNNRLFFVEKGLLYLYKTLQSGDIQVIQFAKEDYWLSDLCSFFTGSRALFSIQSLEDSTLYTLSKKHFDEICLDYPGMETFFRLNFQSAYVNTLIRLSDVYSQDTETKYNRIRDESADLLQRIPQYLIASYLGVLPSSLSRIRSKK